MKLRKLFNSTHPVTQIRYQFSLNALFEDDVLKQFYEPKFTQLKNRSLILVGGPDTRKFLQGITTNNINLLFQEQKKSQTAQFNQKVAIYTLFLNPKGKVVTDGIIIRPLVFENGSKKFAEDQLWIDAEETSISNLFDHLSLYTWKKKVILKNLRFQEEKPQIHVGFPQSIVSPAEKNQSLEEFQKGSGTYINSKQLTHQDDKSVEEDGYSNMIYFDPRGSKYGVRLICGQESFKFTKNMKQGTQLEYQKMLRLAGISSSYVMNNKLPFMFNGDLLNGFSFGKGCYLGQQIIARSYFTGIVRRRVFPFILEDQGQKLNRGEVVYGENNVQLGKVLESFEGYGTILCPYLPLIQKPWPQSIVVPKKGHIFNPLHCQIKQYLKDMREKQTKLQQIDL